MSKPTRLLLATLLQEPLSWRHGYQISKETGLKAGTLYPLLMRLSDLGYLASRWKPPEQPGRPPRHMYRLNARGLALAQEIETQEAKAPVGERLAGARA
jgi:DNA-binding PadR family transcriptional regulator